MNLSRKNKKSSKKLITKSRKKSSKKSIIKSRKKITRKLRKKYNKNKLKFNKINGGTQTPSRLQPILSLIRSRVGRSNNPVIEPAVGTIVGAQVPHAKVKTETVLRNDEVLLKNALEITIRYMENVVLHLNNMYGILETSPIPGEARTYLSNATNEWNNAFYEGLKIRKLLNIVISNGMATNNHANVAQRAHEAREELLLNNLAMNKANTSVQKFLNNRSYDNPELVLFDKTGVDLFNEAINITKLLVENLNNTVNKLNVLHEHVNTMISNQVEPRRAQTIPMGVPASQ